MIGTGWENAPRNHLVGFKEHVTLRFSTPTTRVGKKRRSMKQVPFKSSSTFLPGLWREHNQLKLSQTVLGYRWIGNNVVDTQSIYIYSVMGWVCLIHSSFEPWSKKEKKRFHRISVHEMMKSSQITFTMSSDLYVLPMFNTKKTSSVSHFYRLKHTPPQITTHPGHTWASRGMRSLPSTGGKQSLVQTNITTTNITYRSALNFDCPYFWHPPAPMDPMEAACYMVFASVLPLFGNSFLEQSLSIFFTCIVKVT